MICILKVGSQRSLPPRDSICVHDLVLGRFLPPFFHVSDFLVLSLASHRLEDNEIASLPDAIQTLSSLRILNVERNRLTTFKASLPGALPRLQMLALGSNKISSFEVTGEGALKTLRRLDLEDNDLTAWPIDLKRYAFNI